MRKRKSQPAKSWKVELFDLTPGYGASAVQYFTSERRPTKRDFEDEWMELLRVSPGPLEQESYFRNKVRCKVSPVKMVIDTQQNFAPVGPEGLTVGSRKPKAPRTPQPYDPFNL